MSVSEVIDEANRRAQEATARAELAEARVAELERLRDDHPNTSWGALYADRDRWRLRFYTAARAVMIDGVSLLEWRERALQAEALLKKIKATASAIAAA